MTARKTEFQKALQQAIRDGNLVNAMEEHEYHRIALKRDAEAVVEALRHIRRVPKQPKEEDEWQTTPLFWLLGLFKTVQNQRALVALVEGIPELERIFLASFPPQEDDSDDLLDLLGILVLTTAPEAVDLVARMASHPSTYAHLYAWRDILKQLEEGHPLADEIVARLSDPLPSPIADIAFLDLANRRGREGKKEAHPFDTAKGLVRLDSLLRSRDPEDIDCAYSAAAAIPFLRKTKKRQQLLDLAGSHADAGIRLESYWAAGKLGDERGIAAMAELTRDPRTAKRALDYLEELGRLDAVPPEARTEEHAALCEMANWLSHPSEYGESPHELRVYDSREMFWPPTNDRRRLWLIEYVYEPSEEDPEERPERETGIGMAGSMTVSLYGKATSGTTPEDLYGLHCAWELHIGEDPRAPKKVTAKAGRKILERAQ